MQGRPVLCQLSNIRPRLVFYRFEKCYVCFSVVWGAMLVVKCLWEPEEGTRSCGTELTGSQEPPNMSASNQSRVWREKRMLLTAEPPLQSLIFYSHILHTNPSNVSGSSLIGKIVLFKISSWGLRRKFSQ